MAPAALGPELGRVGPLVPVELAKGVVEGLGP